MGALSQADLDRLLNQPIYSWDTQTMLAGVVDFLSFSEDNLSWQRQREVKKAKIEGEDVQLEPPDEHLADQYRSQLIEAAEYRFDVSLAQSIRYGGLVALVTAIELCARAFSTVLLATFPKAPEGENEHVFLLSNLNKASSAGFDADVTDIKNLVYVRNCVVHAAGLVERHKYAKDIPETVRALKGFSIYGENFLGQSVHIERGALEAYARRATEWVPQLHERSASKGLLKT